MSTIGRKRKSLASDLKSIISDCVVQRLQPRDTGTLIKQIFTNIRLVCKSLSFCYRVVELLFS